MGQLIVDLIPVLLGVVLSPLAIMALVAVLLSRLARVNGVAYLIGWVLGLAGLLALFMWLFTMVTVHPTGTLPLWVPIVRLVLGVFLVLAAVWVYGRGHASIRKMAAANSMKGVIAAAPQLPGWLRSVESFHPFRTFLLGFGLFVLNPVDASCAILAALDISLSSVDETAALWIAFAFVVIGTLPILIPVLFVVIKGAEAQPFLDRIRTWIASNTHVLNAALLLVVGVLQLQKGVSGLL